MNEGSESQKPWRVTVWVLLLAGLLGALALLFTNARDAVEGAKGLQSALAPEPRETSASFRETSAQVNVGCGDTAAGSVSAALPDGAFQIQPHCEWVDTDDNLKSATCETSIMGSMVKATGTIVGLDRNFFGDCRGGGHGKLQVSGTYRLKVQ